MVKPMLSSLLAILMLVGAAPGTPPIPSATRALSHTVYAYSLFWHQDSDIHYNLITRLCCYGMTLHA